MMPFVHVGGLTISLYGACLVTAALLAYFVLRAQIVRQGNSIPAGPLVVGILAVGLAGAYLHGRLAAAFAGSSASPGLTYYGAVAAVLIALPAIARLYRIRLLALCALLAPATALAYGVGRLGCFFAGDGDYGVATSLPWGMTFPNGVVPTLTPVHPTPLYELATSVAIAWWLLILSRRRVAPDVLPAIVFGQYLLWTGLARFLVEFIKRNPAVLAGLAEAQLIAIASVACGILLYARAENQQMRTI